MIVTAKWDKRGVGVLARGKLKAATLRALRKAGATGLRDMRSEASRRIRQRKAIRAKYISRALSMSRPSGNDIAQLKWALHVSGAPIPLTAYPARQTRKGVSVEVNRGKRTLIAHAFLATMKSGHQGVFKREGKARLPIRELLGSRPVDSLMHEGEAQAVAERGARSLSDTFHRLLPIEVAKGKGK